MKECKNMFLYGGPIGRKWFIINLFFYFLIAVACSFILFLIHYIWGINIYTKVIMIGLMVIFMLFTIYLAIVNYAKRLYDIIGQKGKSLLYVILAYVGLCALGYISHFAIVSRILGICAILFLCIKKGKLYSEPEQNIQNSQE